jgi:aldehyde dehydrogenase (NAD+)
MAGHASRDVLVGKNYIGGSWRASDGDETYTTVDPMHPSRTVGVIAASTETDVKHAVESAAAASTEWAALSTARRGRFLELAASALESHAEEVAQDITAEMGKPIRDARTEVAGTLQLLRYTAQEAFWPRGEHYEQLGGHGYVLTHRRPLGVIAAITPWNFPCLIPVRKLAPALVYGNTVVLKPAHDAALGSLHIAAAFEEAELPPGVLNVLTGSGSRIGSALLDHPEVRGVTFTGSTEVGRWLRDAATPLGVRGQLEMGGQNFLVVMADADLDAAVEAAFAGAYFMAGQKCTSTRRIFAQDAVYERFKRRLTTRVQQAKVGDPTDPQVELGPVANKSQFEEVMAAIDRGQQEGGSIVAGGQRLDDEGYIVAPTLFESVPDDAYLSRQEVFGPVASLYRFKDLDEALARANALDYGLSAAIFTSSLSTARRFEQEAKAGVIHVNSQTCGAEVHVPFGGIDASGFGAHEMGRSTIEFFTDLITVYVDA